MIICVFEWGQNSHFQIKKKKLCALDCWGISEASKTSELLFAGLPCGHAQWCNNRTMLRKEPVSAVQGGSSLLRSITQDELTCSLNNLFHIICSWLKKNKTAANTKINATRSTVTSAPVSGGWEGFCASTGVWMDSREARRRWKEPRMNVYSSQNHRRAHTSSSNGSVSMVICRCDILPLLCGEGCHGDARLQHHAFVCMCFFGCLPSRLIFAVSACVPAPPPGFFKRSLWASVFFLCVFVVCPSWTGSRSPRRLGPCVTCCGPTRWKTLATRRPRSILATTQSEDAPIFIGMERNHRLCGVAVKNASPMSFGISI